jgi:hypothetical protein
MRSISIEFGSIRDMVSCFVVLLHLVRVGFGTMNSLSLLFTLELCLSPALYPMTFFI